MEARVFAALKERIGERHLGKRLCIQGNYLARMFVRNDSFRNFHHENNKMFNALVTLALKTPLSYGRGAKNALNYGGHEFSLRRK